MKKIVLLFTFLVFVDTNSQNITNLEVNFPTLSQLCNVGDCTFLSATYFDLKTTDDYIVSSIPYYFISTGGISYAQGQIQDDRYAQTFLPFNFCFYGNSYNQVALGTNGVLTFDSTIDFNTFCPWSFNFPIPFVGFPIKNAIYAPYQDLNPSISPTHIYKVFLIGVEPSRKLVIEYKNFLNFSCGESSGFQDSQIVLHQTSNIIDINVKSRVPCTTWNNGNGVIGIQNQTGTMATVAPGRNTGSWTTTNESWRFTPNGQSITSLKWYQNDVVISTENNISFCPEIDGVIKAVVTYENCDGTTTSIESNSSTPLQNILTLENPNNINVCYNPNGIYTADLTINNEQITSSLDESIDVDITFHNSYFNAQNLIEPFSNSTNFSFTTNQTIYVAVEGIDTGCISVKSFDLIINDEVLPPSGNSSQNYNDGETLADLFITGSNIKWYDSSIGGNELPISTLLVDNTQYHASQTINTCESSGRFSATAQRILNANTFGIKNLKIYPNPFSSEITISSDDNLNKIEIFDTLGRKVFEKNINSLQVLTLNVGSISNGTYLIKVYSNDKNSTSKLLKN